MTDPTPERERRPLGDEPVMGDRPELETEDPFRPEVEPAGSGDMMSRLLVPGIIVLVIVVIAIIVFMVI